MKWRWLCVLVTVLFALTACMGNGYRDDQVYIVNKGRNQMESDELLSWLSVEGPHPFHEVLWPKNALLFDDVPLFFDQEHQVLWLFVPDSRASSLAGQTVIGDDVCMGRLVAARINDGTRTVVMAGVPFVSKVIHESANHRLYLYGGHRLLQVDLNQETAQQELTDWQSGLLQNVFVSPADPKKLFLNAMGSAGGLLYYTDLDRVVSLYQTSDRIYPKGVLEKPYYYSTTWRESGKDHQQRLWSVVSDDHNNVVRLLAQGSFVAGFEKKVLVNGTNGFGLSLVTDLNVPDEVTRVTEQYVYQAGFIAGGESFWLGDGETEGKKPFLLHILDINGKERLSVPVSGSEVLISEDGLRAYSSGAAQEVVDLSSGTVLKDSGKQSDWAGQDQSLRELTESIVQLYGRTLLGDTAAGEDLKALLGADLYNRLLAGDDISEATVADAHITAMVLNDSRQPWLRAVEWTLAIYASADDGRYRAETVTMRFMDTNGSQHLVDLYTENTG